jgi:hypothetical protein
MRTNMMRIVTALAVAGGMAAIAACVNRPAASARLRVAVSFPESVASTPLDGRMLLLVSTDGSQEPRFQRLTYSNRFIPALAAHWQKTAPSGADTKSWRY